VGNPRGVGVGISLGNKEEERPSARANSYATSGPGIMGKDYCEEKTERNNRKPGHKCKGLGYELKRRARCPKPRKSASKAPAYPEEEKKKRGFTVRSSSHSKARKTRDSNIDS